MTQSQGAYLLAQLRAIATSPVARPEEIEMAHRRARDLIAHYGLREEWMPETNVGERAPERIAS